MSRHQLRMPRFCMTEKEWENGMCTQETGYDGYHRRLHEVGDIFRPATRAYGSAAAIGIGNTGRITKVEHDPRRVKYFFEKVKR